MPGLHEWVGISLKTMHRLYSLTVYLATPLALLYLLFRGLKNPAYLKRWPERFGFCDPPETSGCILVHAASMGEVNAAVPLVKAIQKLPDSFPITITTLTPTGAERVAALFGTTIDHLYAPLDTPGAVKRFYNALAPRLLIVMESEIWPHLYSEAVKRNVPVLLANARLSDKSLAAYRRYAPWIGRTVALAKFIGAQSERDAERLALLGADPARIRLTGNLKFDLSVPEDIVESGLKLRQQWDNRGPVFVAGSAREPEFDPLFTAWRSVLKLFPDALLVIAPRQPERFGQAAQSSENAGLTTLRLSQGAPVTAATQCLVIDTMGELLRFYAAADVTFIGGTLCPTGGHNALEPAALGKPVLLGPHTFSLAEIADKLLAAGGALRVADEKDLAQVIIRLFGDRDKRQAMGRAAQSLVNDGRGAVDQTMVLVNSLINPGTELQEKDQGRFSRNDDKG
jgi:3-deoxy-D-manno-octulosonic-acid transferase